MSELNFLYVPSTAMGYGRAGSMIANELRLEGVDVYNHLTGTEPADVDPSAREGRSNVVCWMSTPTHADRWWKGQVPVIYTMWEATRLPEDFYAPLHNFETVIVPSPHNLELFSQYHNNVKYLPLGVDPNVWCYRERKPPGPTFNFLIGGSGARKGTDLAVTAFQKLWGKHGSWGSGPTPVLQLKNPRGEQFFGPRIEMHSGRLSDDEEVNLYANAHCYLQPARGEGFGLQPLQAIAQGMPTILTDAHGHKSFSHLGIPLPWHFEKSAYFIYGESGDWWVPELDALCERMEWVYNNYDDATASAKVASGVALQRFTWNITANGMLDAIGRDRLTGYVGPEEMVLPDRKLFKVITKNDHHCNIGGLNFFFEHGQEYWQTADVKRVLFEAGVLSPDCLDEGTGDTGLTEWQLTRLGAYKAQHSNCPTCHLPVNRPDSKDYGSHLEPSLDTATLANGGVIETHEIVR